MKQPRILVSLVVSLIAVLVAAAAVSAMLMAEKTAVVLGIYQACVDYASFVHARQQDGLTPDQIDRIGMALSKGFGRGNPRETLVGMCGSAQDLLPR